MTTTEVASVIVAIISVIGAGASAFFAFSQNRRSIKNDIINDYEKRMKQVEKDLETTNTKLTEIKALLDKREGELKTITDVLQGRNPEMTMFMETVTHATKQAIPFMNRANIMLEALMHHSDLPIPPIVNAAD